MSPILCYCTGMPGSSPLAMVQIDQERCHQCGACVRVCPVVRLRGYTRMAQVTRDACLRCGHCAAVCPERALEHDEIPADACTPLSPPSSPDDLLQAIQLRRSIRQYATRPVKRTDWQALLHAMAHTPSGTNARPVRAIVATRPETLAALSAHTLAFFTELLRTLNARVGRVALRLALGGEAFAKLLDSREKLATLCGSAQHGFDPILYGAPGALILHAERLAVCGRDDCVLSAMTAMLFAPTLGLGTCMIGFMLPAFQRRSAMRALIDLPVGHDVHAVLAVGYPNISYPSAPPRPPIPVEWR